MTLGEEASYSQNESKTISSSALVGKICSDSQVHIP